ncbi:flagella synthesis protein FlgN [Azovibrio restrictus]|uniref:flagella synthesis protein FlgN n=1 Tax=Azovibrio restrictus TaxID=146938 RepID=UPI0026E9F146|nr:flagellar protein FlgN [Azovibrio restrictus]
MSSTFAQLLAAEISAVQRFVALLKEEEKILRGNQLDALEKLMAEKDRLIEELSRIGEARQGWFAAAGITENRESIEKWLQTQSNPRLSQAWQALQRLAREAKALNELNGQCIALLSHNNRKLLETLRSPRADVGVYGPDGQTSLGPASRISDSV